MVAPSCAPKPVAEKYSNADGMMEAAIAPGLYLGIRGRVLLDCEAVIVCVQTPQASKYLYRKQGIKTTGRDASAEHMLSSLEGTLDLEGSSDHREGQILISDSHLHDAVHQPPPVPPLGSVHRTGIGRGRRRRSSPGSRPLAPRSLPLRSTSRVRGAVRDDGGPQTGSNEVLYFDHITR